MRLENSSPADSSAFDTVFDADDGVRRHVDSEVADRVDGLPRDPARFIGKEDKPYDNDGSEKE